MIENSCKNCRYRERTNLKEPCCAGAYQLAHSKWCFQWKKRRWWQVLKDKFNRIEPGQIETPKGQQASKEYSEIYAVDFDKTLNLAESYPELGKPNKALFDFLIAKQQEGDKIILWTCRDGDYLKSAIKYCSHQGLRFDAINDNLEENVEYFKNNSRKVWAHHYIDDRNMYFPAGQQEE